MDDLDKHIDEFKKANPEITKPFDIGYEEFKIGAILKMAREEAGLTQDEVAKKIGTYKTNISRLEKHAGDVKLSTIEKYANALGKKMSLSIS